ncbi:MAG: hypothetical protein ACLSUW_01380 [Akkermansia sp.]
MISPFRPLAGNTPDTPVTLELEPEGKPPSPPPAGPSALPERQLLLLMEMNSPAPPAPRTTSAGARTPATRSHRLEVDSLSVYYGSLSRSTTSAFPSPADTRWL